MSKDDISEYIDKVEEFGGDWTFHEDDEKVKEAYYLSHSVLPELDLDKDWAEFLSRRCAVCGIENPNKIHLFSPSKEFARKYLFIQSDELHKIVFTRICTVCSKHPGFIDALKRKLIKIYSGTN